MENYGLRIEDCGFPSIRHVDLAKGCTIRNPTTTAGRGRGRGVKGDWGPGHRPPAGGVASPRAVGRVGGNLQSVIRNFPVLVALIVAIAIPVASSAKIAVFVDGRILKVDDAYLEGDQIVLDLRGGGRMVVPAVRLERVVADEVDEIPRISPEYGSCPAGWSDDPLPQGLPFSSEIRSAARAADLNPRLLAALVKSESNFDPVAVSRAGAKGLTQLMPSAAADHGITDVFDPAANLAGGATHLRAQLDRFVELPLALAAYNAGATTVKRYGGIPPYRETQQYVRNVLRAFCPVD